MRDWQIIGGKPDEHEFTLIPLTDEATSTPAIPFSAFDPEAGKFYDLTIPPQPITVVGESLPMEFSTLDEAGEKSVPLKLSSLAVAPGKSTSLSPPQLNGWLVGAQLSVPLFNGFLTREQTAEANAQVAAAEFALNNRLRQIRLLVEQADQSIRDAVEQVAASEKSREAFAENLRLATGRYEAGAADIIEMIDAQVQMTTAETNLVRARFDQALALASLYRALGRLPRTGS